MNRGVLILLVVLSAVAVSLADKKHHHNKHREHKQHKVVPHAGLTKNHGHCKKTFRGCTITEGTCKCHRMKACTNPFPYKTRAECKGDQQGKRNTCLHDPCLHGECAQVIHKPKQVRSYFCECAGSGYYGRKCEHKCPPVTTPLPSDYPPACVDP